MVTNQELEHLLQDLESDRVERKASASDRSKIRKTICAFANDLPGHGQPGVIFIGVKDDGSCSNLRITDELLKTLSNMRSDGNILPPPTMVVQKHILNGCELVVISVEPSDSPPVRYQGMDSGRLPSSYSHKRRRKEIGRAAQGYRSSV